MESSPVITMRDLTRHYAMGEETVKALDGVNLEFLKTTTLQSWDPREAESRH